MGIRTQLKRRELDRCPTKSFQVWSTQEKINAMKLTIFGSLLLTLVVSVNAQTFWNSGAIGYGVPPITTVGKLSLWISFGKGAVVTVKDGASSTDCSTGGGSTLVLCGYSGSSWSALSGGGSMIWPNAAGIAVYGGSSAWGTSIAETDGDIVAGFAGAWTATATPVFGKNAIATGMVGLANGNSGGATYTLENVTATSPILENQPPLAASGVKGCTNAAGTETCSFSGDSNHSYFSGTQTSAVTTQTVCSTTYCTAGTYQVLVYVNETGTGCTAVGSGTVKTELNYTNNQSNAVSGAVVPINTTTAGLYGTGMGLSTTGTQYAQGSYVVNTNGTAAITLSTVLTACTTVGSWSGYQVRAYVTPIG